jgi:hypothetical protein
VKLYADRPRRTLAQLLGDLCAVAWTALWVRLAFRVHETVLGLGAPGRRLEEAGTSLGQNLHEAGEVASRVPLVGDELRTPFESAAGAGETLAAAGRDQQAAVADLAVTLAAVTLVVPLVLVLWWLVRRLRWIRAATAAQRLLRDGADVSLFALRALASQPLPRLRAVAADPVAGWRDGDPEVLAALARLELTGLGLRARPR